MNLSLTPRVAASGDITLEFAAEFSILGGNQNVGSVQNPLFVPTFLTRNVTGVLRLRDGEAALIGGLVQSSETVDAGGVLGVSAVSPFSASCSAPTRGQFKDSEVVISMTPHIVRAPKLVESDFRSLRVGTQEVPRVEGARPGLFGKEPETPEAGPAPGAAAAAAPGTRPAPAPAVVPASAAPNPAAPARRLRPGGPEPGGPDPAAPTPGGPEPGGSEPGGSEISGSARPGLADGTSARGSAGGIARSAGGERPAQPPPCRPRLRRTRGR